MNKGLEGASSESLGCREVGRVVSGLWLIWV